MAGALTKVQTGDVAGSLFQVVFLTVPFGPSAEDGVELAFIFT